MRRQHASSGLGHSCAEGAESSFCIHYVVSTKTVVRVELEQQTYADSNTVHETATNFPERISSLQALLEGAPPVPDCKLLWHCAFEELLDGTRDGSKYPAGRSKSETKTNGRIARSNRRAGKVERSNASHGNVHRQRRESGDLILNYGTNPIPSGCVYS